MSKTPAPPFHPIQELMDLLLLLRKRLSHTKNSDMDILDAYSHFVNISNEGRRCRYAEKCVKKFIENDHDEIAQLFFSISDIYKKLNEYNK